MTESDLGLDPAERRQHEQRMNKWSCEWFESAAWELAEPDAEVMETTEELGIDDGFKEGADE